MEVSTVKALAVAIFYFYRAFKNNSDKNQLVAIGGICAQSLSIIFAILIHVCKHHVYVRGIARVLSLFIVL